MKVKQLIRTIEDGTGRIGIVAIAVHAIIMLCSPIDVTPGTGIDFLALCYHKYSICDHRTCWAAPIVIRRIDKLNIVVVRNAVYKVEGGIVLKDILGYNGPWRSYIIMHFNSDPVVRNRIVRNGNGVASDHHILENRCIKVLDNKADQRNPFGTDRDAHRT